MIITYEDILNKLTNKSSMIGLSKKDERKYGTLCLWHCTEIDNKYKHKLEDEHMLEKLLEYTNKYNECKKLSFNYNKNKSMKFINIFAAK